MAGKTDFRKTLDTYQATLGEFRVLDVPDTQYLMLDGHGDPNTSTEFADAISTLYPIAYALKFASKEAGRDYVVPPLEGLWWATDMDVFTAARSKANWDWTLMLLVPPWLGQAEFDEAVAKVRQKSLAARVDDVRLEILREGTCVQTLHIGSFDEEGPVLARMHDEVIPRSGLKLAGKHHEIYLSDFRRVAPERLRTILRQPVEPA